MKHWGSSCVLLACVACGGKTDLGGEGLRPRGVWTSSSSTRSVTSTTFIDRTTEGTWSGNITTTTGYATTVIGTGTGSTWVGSTTVGKPGTWVETTGPSLGDAGVGACPLPAEAAQRWLAFDSDRIAYNRDIYLVRADGSQLIRFTTALSTEKEPAISHDGKTLAFTSDRTGVSQVFVMDLATLLVRQLTTYFSGADQPNWSADDQTLAFHSGPSVYVMGADGSNPHVIGTGIDDFNAYKHPSLTPDGTQVIFDRNNELDTLHLDGTGFRYVIENTTTTIETPSVAPDGVNVAFAILTGSAEQIAVAPIGTTTDGFTAEAVTPSSSGSARKPAWGPAGVIAFEHGAPGSAGWQISTATIALSVAPGVTPCDLVLSPGDNRNPSWAPAGWQP
jgi:dipeptidyl aminopeptidase/acylaminoacyl peptidase